MIRRLLLTTSTVFWLWGFYACYSATITPLLQPTDSGLPNERIFPESSELPSAVLNNNSLAVKYLRHAPWTNPAPNADENQQPNHMHFGDHLHLYAVTIEHQGQSKEVDFRPFAMLVLPRNKTGGETEPVTIVAESATISFEKEFDIHSSPGRIIGGRLKGKVSIKGPDNLSLDGENFTFDEQYESPYSILYSDFMVNFTYGPHSGHGKGIDVQFIRLEGAPPDDIPAIDGIERVRLNRDVHLKLVETGRSTHEPKRGHVSQASSRNLLVDSAGSLTFDLVRSHLTLEDKVKLIQPAAQGKQNSVDCELLVLRLNQFQTEKTPENAFDSDSKRFSGWLPKQLELTGFTATGNPETPIRLRSNEHDLWGEMRSLEYDFKTSKIILLENQNEGVHLRQAGYEIFDPEIHIVHGPENEIVMIEARRAGKISSRGTNQQPFQAEWKDRLVKRASADVPGEDVVELHGQARLIETKQKMSLESEHILAGFTVEKRDSSSVRNSRESPSRLQKSNSAAGFDPQMKNAQLRWVNARENVRIQHLQLTGNAHQLTINFEDSATPLPKGKGNPLIQTTPPRKGTGVTDSRGEKNAAAISDQPHEGQGLISPEDPPPNLTAGELQIKILRHGEDHHVSEVRGLNRFDLLQKHVNGAAPLEVHGQSIHLINRSQLDQEITLSGQPAVVKDQGNSLSGPQIHFERLKNHAEVIGPGEFSGLVSSGTDGKPLEKPERLTVKWREKVTFDGHRITFYEQVVSELQQSFMNCPEMTVLLSEPVSFLHKHPGQGKAPDIRQLECKHQVIFEQNQYIGKQLQLRAWGEVANFKTNKQNGKTTAIGPGTVRVWRYRAGGVKSAGPPSLAQVSHRKEAEADPRRWEYQEIRFRNEMQGNFTQRFTTFKGGVQVIYGPVSLPTEMVPLDELPPDGGTMDCNELQLTQLEGSGEANFNLLGQGNVRLEGAGFHARADEINHDQSKSLYVLRAIGRRHVDLWYFDQDSGQQEHAIGENFDFVVEEGSLKRLNGSRMTSLEGAD